MHLNTLLCVTSWSGSIVIKCYYQGVFLYLMKRVLWAVFVALTSLSLVGCGGEAEYSFTDIQKLSGNFINDKIEFISRDRIYVATANSDVITVKTTSTDNVTFSIVGGVDSALFKIDSVTGKLAFIEKPLYVPDGDNTYEVLVATEDGAGNRAIQIIEVEVVEDITAVEPIINTVLTEYAVLSFDGVVFGIDADAADAQSTLSYSIEGTDKLYFTVDTNGDVRFTEDADTSGKTVFIIDLVVTDGYGNSTLLPGVSITKVASSAEIQPVILSQSFRIVENSLGNALVEIYKAPDATITDVTLSGGDAALFTVDEEERLHLKTAQDFESVGGIFSFNMQVTDSHAQQSSVTQVTVEIKDIDEQFTFTGVHDVAVQEGHIGIVTTIGAEANAIKDGVEKVFSLELGSEYLTISSEGVISFKNPAQRDMNITVQVGVESQFNGSKTLSTPMKIVVVDDPSKIAPALDNNYPRTVTVVETETVLMHVQATPDGNATSVSYALSGTDAGLFSVDSSGNISTALVFDEEGSNVYTFIVDVTDDNGNMVSTDMITLTLLQDPDNIRPVIQTTTLNIAENSTAAMNVVIDSEGNGIVNTYMVTGDDSALFTFDAAGLRFKSAADFESTGSAAATNSYHVILQVTDSLGNASDTKAVVVNVTDVDETLQFTSLSSFTAVEGSLEVGTIHANGKDSTAVTVLYTLNSHTDIFSIDAVSGVLAFRSPALLGGQYELNISAQSQFNGSLTETTVSVDVAPLSYAITFTPQGVANLDQYSVIPVQISASSAASLPLTYTMAAGTDTSIFAIDAVTGVMTVTVPAYIFSADPEANIYRGAVVASDGLGHSATQQGELHVNPVNGLPEFVTSAALTVNENEKLIAQLEATSPIGSPLSYEKVTGLDSADFDITADGLLTFALAKNFEDPKADGNNTYEVEIRVTDTLYPVNNAVMRFMVTVADVDDAPSNIVFQATNSVSASVDDGTSFLFSSSNRVTDLYLGATPSPSNGALYSTIADNPNSSIFSMDYNGILRVDAPPVSSNITYDLVIEVSEEKGETTWVTMHVTILD